MMCPSDTQSSLNSFTNIGKIIGIVIGSILALAIVVCIIITIYLVFCKRKYQRQAWTHTSSRPRTYGQSTSVCPYTNYPPGPIQLSQMNSQRTIESPPPAYEEIAHIGNPIRKI